MSQATDADRDAKIDRWFHGDYALTDTYVGLRGDTMTRAVNGNPDEQPRVVPIKVPPENLDHYDEVDESDVPDWAKGRIEDRFRATDAELDAILGRDSQKEDTGERHE